MGSPQTLSIPATRKKRIPLATTDAKPNTTKFMPTAPLAMVITLYGKGVNPAANTIQAPYSI